VQHFLQFKSLGADDGQHWRQTGGSKSGLEHEGWGRQGNQNPLERGGQRFLASPKGGRKPYL
jgi:hypothetical protein